jgi:hypothetical protein
MRALFQHSPFRRRALCRRTPHSTIRTMSTPTAATVLYALTVSNAPTRPGPEDVLEKTHHTKSGFRNPWEYVSASCKLLQLRQSTNRGLG